MKLAISAAALVLVLGTTGSAYARPNKAQDEHPQGEHQKAKSEKKQTKPAENHAKPAQHEEHAHPQPHPVSHPQHPNNGQNHMYAHGRISDAHYAAHFGTRHTFHIRAIDYQHRRFVYGGYNFRFVDPWPVGWAYADPVYVEYVDGGYYMYNPIHPGIRITLSIF